MYNSNYKIRSSNLKAAVLGFAFFIVIVARLAGQPSLPFINPLSGKEISAMGEIRPKLEQKLNEYSLIKEKEFISSVYGGAPYDSASAYAVVDFETGKVLAEKSISKKLPIASITKVMTALTALDLASPDEVFTVSHNTERIIPTRIGLIPGQKLSLKELLNAILLTSANDAAEAIKEGIDQKYGDRIFIEAMNAKAKYIGLKNTHFANPQGFDSPLNYSTAEDLAILSHYALTNYPLIAEIVKKDYEFLPENENHKQFDLYNWNGLIGVYPDTRGIKIGNTIDAGTTTAVISERDGKKILAVLLGAPGVLERDLWVSQLLDYGYEQTLGLLPVAVTANQLQEKYATWQTWN